MSLDGFCILYVDSLPSRIYLQTLINMNLRPLKLINIKILPKSKKYNVVKNVFGTSLAMKALDYYASRNKFPRSVSEFATDMLSHFGIEYERLRTMDIQRLGIDTIDLYVDSINSKKLVRELVKIPESKILFTGGGILRSVILDTHGKQFFHIHPGIVPEIRGADCMLWGFLMRKKFGYSVFLMNEGIDMGDILYREEFSVEILSEKSKKFSTNNFYFDLLNFLDPCLRIATFCNMLANKPEIFLNSDRDMIKSAAFKQDVSDGRMFFFMHKKFRELVEAKLKRFVQNDSL